MLQLQLATHSGAAGTSIRTAPQWQLPHVIMSLPYRHSRESGNPAALRPLEEEAGPPDQAGVTVGRSGTVSSRSAFRPASTAARRNREETTTYARFIANLPKSRREREGAREARPFAFAMQSIGEM